MSHPIFRRLFWLILLFGAMACTSTEQGARSGQSSPNTIQFDELTINVLGKSAYEVIQDVRPQWLRTRGRDSIHNPGEVMVYLDGVEYGSVDSLRELSAENIDSVEYLSSREAQYRFGTGNTQGAMIVHMKGG